jgi:hypothetical protein
MAPTERMSDTTDMNMAQPVTRQLGKRGATAATLFFETLGWGVVEMGEHDLGSDLIIHIRDSNMREMSLVMGVQVKTGPSHFAEPTTVDGQPGWTFRETDQRHANYWANNPFPHIVLLQSEDLHTRVWAFANRETIKDTGKGFTIFVPKSQSLTEQFRDAWIEAADSALKKVALEGSRWTFDIESIPATDHARFALLAPHVVAPHPNKGDKTKLRWPEAVALVLLAAAERWEWAATADASTPAPGEANSSPEWGWKFAGAVYRWVYDADVTALESLDSSSAPRQWKFAHAVALAIALVDGGRGADATDVLKAHVVEAECSVEQGWLSTHLSHFAMEQGNFEEAKRLAELSNVQLAPVGADVTVSAVRAAAAWAIFDTRNFISSDVGQVVAAMDNATSWWRTQVVSAGLESAVQRQFGRWAHDRSVTFGGADTAHNLLSSAALGARISASYGQARALGSLLGMIDLSTKRPADKRPLSALHILRDAGDEKKLQLAIREISQTGPLADLRELVDGLNLDSMTRTTSRADLRIVQRAGDFASDHRAEALIEYLLAALEAPGEFAAKVSARYMVEPALLEALAGLRSSLNADHWHRIAGILVVRAEPPHEITANTLKLLVRESRFNDDDKRQLAGLFGEAPEWYRWVLIHALGADHEIVRDEIQQGLNTGSLKALDALGRHDLLDQEQVRAFVDKLTCSLASHPPENDGAGVLLDTPNVARHLAVVNVNHPQAGGWEALAHFFADETVPDSRKREPALVVSQNISEIPVELLASFRAAAETARAQKSEIFNPLGLMTEVGGALECLHMALMEDGDPRRDGVLLGLLIGDSAHRRDAVQFLAHTPGAETQLASLINDDDPIVAAEAAAGLARSARRSPQPNPHVVQLLATLAAEDRLIGLQIAVGLFGPGPMPEALMPIIEILGKHKSARVRRIVEDLDDRHETQDLII